jgi:polysaccharide export outer membrane protein
MRNTFFVVAILLLQACQSSKNFTYFYNNNFSTAGPIQITNQNQSYRIQANDIVSIQVNAENQANVQMYNLTEAGGNMNEVSVFVKSYSVALDGTITLPVLGEVKVLNMTLDEIRDAIRKRIEGGAMKTGSVSVIVHLLSFKISVVGEVKNPGYFRIYNNQVNILEAIALAGDLNDFADRKKLNLIRQNPQGSEAIVLDMTDINTLSSKYFYLQPNDVIVVPPSKIKAKRANLPLLTATFAGISTTVLILNLINNVLDNK